MNTVEDRAGDVLKAIGVCYEWDRDIHRAAAILRADRSAVLMRVEEVFKERLKERFALHPRVQSSFLALGFETTDIVKKEVL